MYWSLEETAGNRPDRKVGKGVVSAMSAEGATLVVPRSQRSLYFSLLSRPDGRACSLSVLRTSIRIGFNLPGAKSMRHYAVLPRSGEYQLLNSIFGPAVSGFETVSPTAIQTKSVLRWLKEK